MDAQRVDGRFADALAGYDLGRDRLPLARLPIIDAPGGPRSQAVTGQSTCGNPSQPALYQLPRTDRRRPRVSLDRVIPRSSQQDAERAGGLGGERDAAAVEAMPHNLHAIGRTAVGHRHEQVGGVHFKAIELDRCIVGVLEWMEGVAAEPKRRGVCFRQTYKHNARMAIQQCQELDHPAIRGPGNKHLRPREKQPSVPASDRRANPAQIATSIWLGGSKD